MAKESFQDIIRVKSVNKKLIQNKAESSPVRISDKTKKLVAESTEPRYIKNKVSKRRNTRYTVWFLALIALVALFFAISLYYKKAYITVHPQVKEYNLTENFSAVKDGKEEELPFELVILEGEEKKTIEAGEKKDVSILSKGSVILYNNFSSAPQNLSQGTKLSGTNGKIYKTDKKLSIPGKKKDGTPGSVETVVYALEAGEEYDSPPMDFKIVGFKGTAKYEKFYGRSKGAITGGKKGQYSQVAELERIGAESELKGLLKTKLSKKITDQIPPEYILYKDAFFLKIDDAETGTVSAEGEAEIKVKGTLYGLLFSEKKLTKKIAERMIEKYDGAPVFIPQIRDLSFNISNSDVSFADLKNFSFSLTGPIKVIWQIDPKPIAEALAGKEKSEFESTMTIYTNIAKADSVIRPFWLQRFPEDKTEIEVKVVNPN